MAPLRPSPFILPRTLKERHFFLDVSFERESLKEIVRLAEWPAANQLQSVEKMAKCECCVWACQEPELPTRIDSHEAMKAALQILGHKNVHHGYELYQHPQQADIWLRAWNAKAQPESHAAFTDADWDSLLGPYSAVTDMPSVCFAPELIAAYPEAKVILSMRDIDSWYESFNSGVIETFWDNCRITGIMSWLDPELMRPIHQMWSRLFACRDGYFEAASREEMQANAKRVFEVHNAAIKKCCPQERLLEFEVKDGWGPLCKFLEVPVPNQPFPRVNEGEAVKDVVATYVQRSMRKIGRNLAVGVAIFALTIQAARMAWKRLS